MSSFIGCGKLNFSERAKNRSRQNAAGAIREGQLMVLSLNFSPFAFHSEFFRRLFSPCIIVFNYMQFRSG